MDPTLHGTRGCRRLVAEACHSDEPDHLGRAGATRWWRPAFTQTIQQTCVSRTPATVSSTTTAAPCSQGQPAAAHRPPKARQLPAGVPATGERPGHQTGLSSSRGVRLFPRRLAARASWFGASTPLGVAQSPLRVRARPPSARARCPSRRACKVCLLRPWAGAAQSRAARLNAASDLGSPARLRPRAPIGRARGRSAAK
jgi:hypothetical protein